VAGFEVHVADGQAAQFRGANAGVEQKIDDAAVAGGGRDDVLTWSLAGALVGRALVHGGQEGFDLGLAEGIDEPLFGSGLRNVAHDVAGGDAFGDGPAPESRQRGVMADERFLAEGRETVEESFDVGLGDIGDEWIAGEVAGQLFEDDGVELDCVLAEPPGIAFEEESLDADG